MANQSIKILLVDDDDLYRDITARQILRLGFESVTQAASCQQALSLMAESEFDIIVSDLHLPGMDGIEFLRHIRETAPSAALILLSGVEAGILDAARYLAMAQRINLLGTLRKPADPQQLVSLFSAHSVCESAAGEAPAQQIEPLSTEDVRQAIDAGQVTYVLQPKVRLCDGAVTGAEALARLRADDGLMPAGRFIPVAEEAGLIGDITLAMIESVLAALAGDEFPDEFKISVNVSIDDLADITFADTLIDAAERHGVNLDRLVLEVTESRVAQSLIGPVDILARLRMKGIGLAIDDFGTGAAGFESLQKMPFTELKIDRSFVDGVACDPSKEVILRSMLTVARAFNLNVVAEGVECEADLAQVRALGCDSVQGYFYSPPLTHKEFMAWLASHYATASGQELQIA